MKKWLVLVALLIAAFCLTACHAENTIIPAAIEAGDYVTFGAYEQDNNLDNGPEPIEWIVLDVQEGKAFLLSRYVLDALESKYTIWEENPARIWLNNEFYSAAFSEQERSAILLTRVDNNTNDENVEEPDTDDYLFFLNMGEVRKWFPGEEDRFGIATEYAVSRGVCMNKHGDTDDSALWGVRGLYSYKKVGRGTTRITGMIAGGIWDIIKILPPAVGIRPAMWADLNADIFK